jgi:hypothetical protein
MYSAYFLTAVLRISVNIPRYLAGGNEVPNPLCKHLESQLLRLVFIQHSFYAMFCMASRNGYSFRRIKSHMNTILLLGYNTKIKYLLHKADYLSIERLLVSNIPFCSLANDSATPASPHRVHNDKHTKRAANSNATSTFKFMRIIRMLTSCDKNWLLTYPHERSHTTDLCRRSDG